MKFNKLYQKRRSVRSFLEKTISQKKLKKLIGVLEYIPSSRSIYPLEFIVLEDKNHLKALSQSKDSGAGFLKNAPLAIVIMADETKSDVWVEDASIAATLIMLKAVELKLASCWIQIRNRQIATQSSEDYVKSVLSIPENFAVEAILAIGYPEQKEINPKLKSFDLSKVYLNEYKKELF